MRTIRDPQMQFGEVDIAAIELDLKSRDDIPPILSGLQYIYATPALRASVFKVPERVIPSRSGPGLSNEDRHRKADPRLGRPGMEQWKILALGVPRLGLNPTDVNLLFDAVRKTVEECARLSRSCQLEGWRQYRNSLK